MTFSVEITNEAHLAGITAAREAYNAQFEAGSSEIITTDAAYVVFVMQKAAESYAKQYGTGA